MEDSIRKILGGGDYVLQQRLSYLSKLVSYEEEGYTRVYLDESFVYEHASLCHGWFSSETGGEIYHFSGTGRRIAIVGAVTEQGFLGVQPETIQSELSQANEEERYQLGSLRY